MNKNYWMQKLNISSSADVAFYQNPKFFRSNSFKREYMKDRQKIFKAYIITGVANSHHKHNGKREKICLVRELKKSSRKTDNTFIDESIRQDLKDFLS